jgi:peptidyl-prolyl cis-trans isomerase A (cyclophilin A)
MDVVDALYSGYGENSGGGIRAGKQDSLFTGGNKYIKQRYPKLDYIIRARILKN